MATQLDLAEQQILGFNHANKGFSLNDLLSSMDLKHSEWKKLLESGKVDYLDNGVKKDIEDYFSLARR